MSSETPPYSPFRAEGAGEFITKLSLLYRDANNYKEYHPEVLAGEISEEQLRLIAAKLDDGVFLIAEQVGLPTPSFIDVGNSGWPRKNEDHVFTTLVVFEEAQEDGNDLPEPSDLLTDEPPTLAMDVAAFVAKVQAVSAWDVKAEWARMKRAAKAYNPFGGPGQGLGIDGPSVVR